MVRSRAAATTRTASPARARMGPYGSMTAHAARPPDARRRAGRGVRGRGRVVLAGHAGAQRRRCPRRRGSGCSRRSGGSPRSSPAAVALAWAARASRRIGQGRSSSARCSSCRGCPFRCPPPLLLWAGPVVVARVGGDRRRCSWRRAARRRPGSAGLRASLADPARAPWVAFVVRRDCLQRGRMAPGAARARAATSRTTSSSPRACGATATCASRTTTSGATTSSTSAARSGPTTSSAGPTGRSTRFTCRACRPSSRRCSPLGGYGLVKVLPGARRRRPPRPWRGARRTWSRGTPRQPWFGWAGGGADGAGPAAVVHGLPRRPGRCRRDARVRHGGRRFGRRASRPAMVVGRSRACSRRCCRGSIRGSAVLAAALGLVSRRPGAAAMRGRSRALASLLAVPAASATAGSATTTRSTAGSIRRWRTATTPRCRRAGCRPGVLGLLVRSAVRTDGLRAGLRDRGRPASCRAGAPSPAARLRVARRSSCPTRSSRRCTTCGGAGSARRHGSSARRCCSSPCRWRRRGRRRRTPPRGPSRPSRSAVSVGIAVMLLTVERGEFVFNVRDVEAPWLVWASQMADLAHARPEPVPARTVDRTGRGGGLDGGAVRAPGSPRACAERERRFRPGAAALVLLCALGLAVDGVARGRLAHRRRRRHRSRPRGNCAPSRRPARGRAAHGRRRSSRSASRAPGRPRTVAPRPGARAGVPRARWSGCRSCRQGGTGCGSTPRRRAPFDVALVVPAGRTGRSSPGDSSDARAGAVEPGVRRCPSAVSSMCASGRCGAGEGLGARGLAPAGRPSASPAASLRPARVRRGETPWPRGRVRRGARLPGAWRPVDGWRQRRPNVVVRTDPGDAQRRLHDAERAQCRDERRGRRRDRSRCGAPTGARRGPGPRSSRSRPDESALVAHPGRPGLPAGVGRTRSSTDTRLLGCAARAARTGQNRATPPK